MRMLATIGRKGLVRQILISILAAIALALFRGTAAAGSQYPIPFDATADWQGGLTDSSGIQLPSVRVLPNRVLGHVVVVVSLLATKTLKFDNNPASLRIASRMAYDNLFEKNLKHLGRGDCYVVMIIYGAPDSTGTMPEYAYVFTRTSNHWQSRDQITQKEVGALEGALGNGRI
jgi:hypothetical protein